MVSYLLLILHLASSVLKIIFYLAFDSELQFRGDETNYVHSLPCGPIYSDLRDIVDMHLIYPLLVLINQLLLVV